MDDPNIEKRTATGLVVNLSSYLITGSLAIIGAQAVVVTFTLDKKEHLILFGVSSVLAFVALVVSIYFGGKGINELTRRGSDGEWAVSTKTDLFNKQALLTLVGVIFLAVSILLGSPKETGSAKAAQASIDMLNGSLAQLQQKVQVLEQNQALDKSRLEQLIRANGQKRAASKRAKSRQ